MASSTAFTVHPTALLLFSPLPHGQGSLRPHLLSGASSKAQPTELAPTSRPRTNLGDACLSIVESLLDKFKKGGKLLSSIPKRRLPTCYSKAFAVGIALRSVLERLSTG